MLLSFFLICFCLSVFSEGPTNDIKWNDVSLYSNTPINSPHFIFTNDDKSKVLICYKDLEEMASSGRCKIGDIDKNNEMINFGEPSTWIKANASSNFQMLEPNTKSFILSFTNSEHPSMGPGKALQGDIENDGTITFNSMYTFNTGNNGQSRLTYLTSNSFVICYKVSTLSIYCRLGSYETSNGVINFGLDYMLFEGGRTDGMALKRLNDNQFLVCFGKNFKRIGVCYIGTVNNDKSITYSNEGRFNGKGGTDKIDIEVVDSNTLLLCYVTRNGGACSIGSTNSNRNMYNNVTFSSDTRYPFIKSIIDETSSVIIPPNTINNSNYLILICYVDLGKGDRKSRGVCQFGEIDKNNNIVYGDQIGEFNEENTDNIQLELVSNNTVLLCYSKAGVNGPCRIGMMN